MSKFNVGNRIDCKTLASWGYTVENGVEYTLMFSGKGLRGSKQGSLEAKCAEHNLEPIKPSLRSLYETERDKLTAQQDITTAAWDLVVAEKAMEDNARKALIHAKQDLVDRARDTLKKASEFYLKVSAELDEMLQNETL
jgi:hypothetical protein